MMRATPSSKKSSLIRQPWFAFLSSMRFAVALLAILAIASIIGTVIEQNQPMQNYVVQFGAFWAEIFHFLGLFDVYASSWFVLIMLFLVVSTALCVWRNTPQYWRQMQQFRLNASEKSLSHMKHTVQIDETLSGSLKPEIITQYLRINGFQIRTLTREDGSLMIAAKKGAINKWGYVLAHLALIVICLGGLIDSNLFLKLGILSGRIQPDTSSFYARDFKPESILSERNLSFRGNVEVVESQTVDKAFVNADKGLLLQPLPFSIELKKFHIDFYNTGMPKDFASDIVVTNKKTGEKIEKTIRVNHPLTVNGITIYQSTYADGGSPIVLKSWNLRGIGQPVSLKATSQRQFPLDLGKNGQYQLELGQLQVFNVENMAQDKTDKSSIVQDLRSVQHDKKLKNVGPTITYKLRDSAGQAREYISYMLPLERNGAFYFATGERSDINSDYRWLMLPADANQELTTFMALRDTLMQPEERTQLIEAAVASVNKEVRAPFKLAIEAMLQQFVQGGYVAIDEHIKNNVPAAEQENTARLMYQMLYDVMDMTLTRALNNAKLPEMPQGQARRTFLLNSMDAYTGLTRFGAPILLQLDDFKQVNMSGLQVTKSPGAKWVYLGSVFLVLGILLMFYVREKRAWFLFEHNRIRFAMSSSRHERDLDQEFPKHLNQLTRLANDLQQTQ